MFLSLCARLAIAGLALATTLSLAAPGAYADPAKARFSSTGIYNGAPNLPLTLSMIEAGGGPAHFDSVTLVGTLAGSSTKAEVAKLTKQFGQAKLKSFLTVFNFVVSDSLAIVTKKKIALPSSPDPNPKDGKALSAALYTAGIEDGKYNVEIMLDHLVSHPVHVQVMNDIERKWSTDVDANYHIILTQAVLDLKAAYKL